MLNPIQNPFRRARLDLGLSQAALALLAGLSLPAVQAAELGAVACPRKLLAAFERLGRDREGMAREYSAWLDERRSELREKVAGR